MTKGKIVLVPFPFDDLSGTKVRPAVCLTDPLGSYDHVIIAFITSTIPSDLMPTDIVLDKSHSDFTSSGLIKASTIRLHKLMTIKKSLIQRELGILSSDTQEKIAQIMCTLFTS
ncbi:MAG TPA: type II toxin-antitoxin system PemK/MazF family toxin [Nostocaceae cyanobacterium]|nr:type II toxin-antitoxin system PemK/MazF family toxin [Nostocaceae cyanobacterium]